MVSSCALRAAIFVLSTCLFSLSSPAASARTADATSVDQLLLRARRVADTIEIKRVQCEYGYFSDCGQR